jgi:hypothetical protein
MILWNYKSSFQWDEKGFHQLHDIQVLNAKKKNSVITDQWLQAYSSKLCIETSLASRASRPVASPQGRQVPGLL